MSTTGALVNHGDIDLDFNFRDVGSSLTVAGALTDTSLSLGPGSKLTAASIDNSINITGGIELFGFGANQRLLDVTTGVAGFGTAGTLTGNVLVAEGAIEFLGGQITTIAASSFLTLRGNSAFVEDSTALGSNSALAGLADVWGPSISRAGVPPRPRGLGVDDRGADQ